MSYRCVIVSNPAHISTRSEQLVVETDERHTVPIEDISALMLESRRATLSAAALSALAQNGTAVFVCDEKHLPCGVLLPYAQHSRQLAAARAQLSLTLPAKKRFWQQLVTAKIGNQAECLALCGKTQEAAFLHSRARAVTSGDKDNLEAAAAAYYFPALFGTGLRWPQRRAQLRLCHPARLCRPLRRSLRAFAVGGAAPLQPAEPIQSGGRPYGAGFIRQFKNETGKTPSEYRGLPENCDCE